MRFSLNVKGDDEFVAAIRRGIANAGDLRPTFALFGQEFVELVTRAFARQRGTRAWTPLSPDYARRKAKRGTGRGILEDTGALRRSYLQRGPFRHKVIERRRFAIGSASPTAHLHELGAKRGARGGELPRRPVRTIIGAKVRRRWLAELATHIDVAFDPSRVSFRARRRRRAR